jgi:hypothetical protein
MFHRLLVQPKVQLCSHGSYFLLAEFVKVYPNVSRISPTYTNVLSPPSPCLVHDNARHAHHCHLPLSTLIRRTPRCYGSGPCGVIRMQPVVIAVPTAKHHINQEDHISAQAHPPSQPWPCSFQLPPTESDESLLAMNYILMSQQRAILLIVACSDWQGPSLSTRHILHANAYCYIPMPCLYQASSPITFGSSCLCQAHCASSKLMRLCQGRTHGRKYTGHEALRSVPTRQVTACFSRLAWRQRPTRISHATPTAVLSTRGGSAHSAAFPPCGHQPAPGCCHDPGRGRDTQAAADRQERL